MDTKSEKKMILQKLLSLAMSSSAGRGLEATIDGIKKAMGAFKTYTKEWDNIEAGMSNAQGGAQAGAKAGLKEMAPPTQAQPRPNIQAQAQPNLSLPQMPPQSTPRPPNQSTPPRGI